MLRTKSCSNLYFQNIFLINCYVYLNIFKYTLNHASGKIILRCEGLIAFPFIMFGVSKMLVIMWSQDASDCNT